MNHETCKGCNRPTCDDLIACFQPGCSAPNIEGSCFCQRHQDAWERKIDAEEKDEAERYRETAAMHRIARALGVELLPEHNDAQHLERLADAAETVAKFPHEAPPKCCAWCGNELKGVRITMYGKTYCSQHCLVEDN